MWSGLRFRYEMREKHPLTYYVDRVAAFARCFGFLKLRRDGAVVARNHRPRWLGLPRGGRDCGPENRGCCEPLCRRQDLLLLIRQILGEVFGDSFLGHRQKALGIGPELAT